MSTTVFDPTRFPDYALLDSGGGEKLERFGRVVLRRPDPQALWRPRAAEAWGRADLAFVRESDRGGRWEARRGAAVEARGREPAWTVRYGEAVLEVRPTPFKHVGLFPEQATNWDWVARRSARLGERPRLLNLFGYSGAASVLAVRAGFDVTHVDASRAALAWTRRNAELSGVADGPLRLVLDDALRFARREVRRGSRYAVVLLDPPHYGRGPRGEKWQFEEGFAPLVEACGRLLAERALLVLSSYAIGYSPLAFRNVLGELPGGAVEVGELILLEEAPASWDPSGEPRPLPCGFCARWTRGLEP